MARNKQVLVQIEKAEEILKRTGVRDYCIECIHSPAGGCCQRCSNLGPDGCTDKPLSCSLWLCGTASVRFPAAVNELSVIAAKYPWAVAHGMRQMSIQAEGDLLCA